MPGVLRGGYFCPTLLFFGICIVKLPALTPRSACNWSSLFELPFLVYVYKPDLCCLPQSGFVPEPVLWPVMMPSYLPDNNKPSRAMAPFWLQSIAVDQRLDSRPIFAIDLHGHCTWPLWTLISSSVKWVDYPRLIPGFLPALMRLWTIIVTLFLINKYTFLCEYYFLLTK